MTTVFYSSRAVTDNERRAEFLLATEPHAAADTGTILMEAIAMLSGYPTDGPGKLSETAVSF